MSSRVPRTRITRTPTKVGFWRYGNKKYSGSRDSLLVSVGHPRNSHGGYDTGGPFYQVSNKLTYDPGCSSFGDIWDFGYHWGPCTAIGINGFSAPNDLGVPAVVPAYDGVKDYLQHQYSAAGFSRTRPGNPVASVFQFFTELANDGFPSLPLRLPWKSLFKGEFKDIAIRAKRRVREFVRLGDEHLNYHFGWAPFVGDLRKMYNLWQTLDKHLAQLVRENGKTVHRRATLLNTSDHTVSNHESYAHAGQYVDGFPASVIGNRGMTDFQIERESSTRVWYAGTYKYNVPDIGSSQWTRNAKLALFGATPTPENIWNVIPWSWLTDWFINVNDVLSNASDNAVGSPAGLDSSGYIMMNQKTSTTFTALCQWPSYSSGGSWKTFYQGGTHRFFTKSEVETKCRTAAGSQYQLAAKMDAFTSDHWGILAALGLSRGTNRSSYR